MTSAALEIPTWFTGTGTPSMNGDEEDSNGGGGAQGWGVGGIENSIPVRLTYLIIAFLGITGNFLVIFALIRVPSLRNCTSYFIIHLAATDLVTSIWVIPFHLLPQIDWVPSGFGGELICRLFFSKYPLWVTIFASVYSMVCVTMERFFAVVYPLKYKVLYTTSRIVPMMVSCWLVGAVSNWFFFYNYDYVSGNTCSFVPWPSAAVKAVIGVYIFAVVYFIPITTMLVANWKMIKVLKSQAAALKGQASRGGAKNKEAWQLEVAQDLSRMLLVVVITYAVCWLPNQTIFLAYNLGAPISFSSLEFHLSVILAICNSCINPFIYTFKNKQFRNGVKKALRLRRTAVVEPINTTTAANNGNTATTSA